MSRIKLFAGLILWSAVGIGLLVLWKSRTQPDGNEVEETTVRVGFPTRTLPDFSLTESNKTPFGLQDLKGKRWVASFVFSRCTETCPQILRAVKEVHERVIKEDDETMFVTFSVDHEYDTPEVMWQHSEIFMPLRDQWKFLSGSQQQIEDVVIGGFNLVVQQDLNRRPGMEFAHSNRVVLVNEDGIPVGLFMGTDSKDMKVLEKILLGKKPFPKPGRIMSDDEAADFIHTIQMGVKRKEVPTDKSIDTANDNTEDTQP